MYPKVAMRVLDLRNTGEIRTGPLSQRKEGVRGVPEIVYVIVLPAVGSIVRWLRNRKEKRQPPLGCLDSDQIFATSASLARYCTRRSNANAAAATKGSVAHRRGAFMYR